MLAPPSSTNSQPLFTPCPFVLTRQQPAFPRPSHQLRQTDLSLAPPGSGPAAMAAGTLFWQPPRQSPKPQFFCCVKPGHPARAGARSRASGSHTNIRRLVGRRQGGAGRASPVTAAAVAAAATLPASRVKSWPTANVLAAANGGVGGALRSVSARPVGCCPDASPVGRAPQGGRARSRECTQLAR
eukprot:scaffold132519_cov60-Phaeocystis_antarctica.AAC.1